MSKNEKQTNFWRKTKIKLTSENEYRKTNKKNKPSSLCLFSARKLRENHYLNSHDFTRGIIIKTMKFKTETYEIMKNW